MPNDLMQSFFQLVGTLAEQRVNGQIPTDPHGHWLGLPERRGHDLKQLIQKFALGVTLSHGLGDYLTKVPTKDNKARYDATETDEGTKKYTAMEHYWDEAFGYFGST